MLLKLLILDLTIPIPIVISFQRLVKSIKTIAVLTNDTFAKSSDINNIAN